jgi:hypothetical protein
MYRKKNKKNKGSVSKEKKTLLKVLTKIRVLVIITEMMVIGGGIAWNILQL